MRLLALLIVLTVPGAAWADACEVLTKQYGMYDNAFVFFDRLSKSESSTLRATTAQAAITNIMLRQGMILDMMIVRSCDLPSPPEFPLLGLISSNN